MRGRLVNERYNFERGLDPKQSMDIGKAKLDREKMESIDWAFDPIRFNKFHPGQFKIDEFIENYKGFPILVFSTIGEDKKYRASTNCDYTNECITKNFALMSMKRKIDNLIRRSSLHWGNIKESNFERGQEPKRAMGIDRISKLNREIEWSWDAPAKFKEDIWDIVEYKGYYIKVSKLTTPGMGVSYVAINDTGEPYMGGPISHLTPESALNNEKDWIDDYIAEN